eukprot:SAG31_NODE_1091_length_9958_cov_10.108429_1_plen_200_part_00
MYVLVGGSPIQRNAVNEHGMCTYICGRDTWFYVKGTPLRPLSEMISVYHNSVGMNTVLELDFAIDRTGRVDPAHAALYSTFGDWIRACYGKPVASGSLKAPASGLSTAGAYSLKITAATPVDRIVLQEDQREGERILSYRVVVNATGAIVAKGTAVGNKRIQLFGGGNVTGALQLEVLSTAAGLPPLVTFSAYAACPSG